MKLKCECESGLITGERCDAAAATLAYHFPEHIRASHAAAGNRGRWPSNGSILLHLCPPCADECVDGDWTVGVE